MVGLANVDNTSDLDKPISTATQTALDVKANATDVTTSLALKANITDVNAALALKANATDVTAALDLKVDKVTGKALSTNDYTTAEKTKLAAITGTNTGDQDLSALAVAADVNTALALKANATDVNTALALKANTTDVNTALALKANTADVNTALALKELLANKSVNVATDGSSNTKYPSVKSVKDYVDSLIAVIPAPRPTALATDEFVASAGQTSFTLTHIPSSKVSMFVNGIRIPNAAYSFVDSTLTFDANNNGSHSLVAGDRVQFDYSYLDN
jgi:hypothetical protein